MAENDAEPEGTIGPVLFAYDGSELTAPLRRGSGR